MSTQLRFREALARIAAGFYTEKGAENHAKDILRLVDSQTPPAAVTPLDLLWLARAEFRRYDEFASAGAFEMFSSARLARELMAEAIDQMEAA